MRERRQELKLSPKRFATMPGWDVEDIHRYESGQERIGPARLWLVGIKLNVSVHYFFQGVFTGRTAKVIPFPKGRKCDGTTP